MCQLSNTARRFSYGEVSWQTGNIAALSSGEISTQDLINKANTIPLIKIFHKYGISVPNTRSVITCPFKSHKGGRESSGSFNYFPETNSFFCYGCRAGGESAHAVEFVSIMERVPKIESANRILDIFVNDVGDEVDFVESFDLDEKLDYMLNFSNFVRNFRCAFSDKISQDLIDRYCCAYDIINSKYKINNDALIMLVDSLIEEINYIKL
jgi:hypothetical protein